MEDEIRKPEKREWELQREAAQRARIEELRNFWLSRVLPGSRILEKSSGMTGEVYRIHEWGVEVWVLDMNNSRQNWHWNMLATRFPRKIKRYPRPFRFPREVPTQCCHCKIGRMEVEGEHEVRCTRCKLLVGDESFPRRIKRASSFLRKKYSQPDSGRKVRKRVVRRKRKTSHPHAKRKPQRRVVLRSRGRKEKSSHGKNQKEGNSKVPTTQGAPTIPQTQGAAEIPQAQEEAKERINNV
jgi:hypothetical protein